MPRPRSVLVAALLLAAGGLRAQPGTPDLRFGAGGMVVYRSAEIVDFQDLHVGADGSVLVVGSQIVGEEMQGLLLRLLANGAPDPSFGTDGLLVMRAGGAGGALGLNAVATDGHGRTVVVGGEHRQDTDRSIVGRLSGAALDPTFGTGGISRALPTGTFASRVLPLADGRLVVIGVQNTPAFRCFAARLTAAGALDPTFGTGGLATFNAPSGMFNENCIGAALLTDGRLVVAGTAIHGPEGSVGLFAVLTASGALDPAFDGDGVATIPLCSGSCIPSDGGRFGVDSDGRFVLAGTLSLSVAPGWDTYVARLLPTGLPAPDFGTGGVVRRVLRDRRIGGSAVLDMDLHPDGTLVLTGYAAAPPYSYDLLAARLLPDGTPDPTFGTGGEATLDAGGLDVGRAGALGADGEIVLVGTSDNGSRIAGVVARLQGAQTVAREPAPLAPPVTLRVGPHPVRLASVLTVDLAAPGPVRLALHDLLGRQVVVLHDGPLTAGTHRFSLPAEHLSSGLYVARAEGPASPASLRVVVAQE